MLRRALVAAAATVILPGLGQAQTGAQANRSAYDYALRCFAATGGVITDPRAAPGDRSAAEASARRSFDAAHRMGRVLGFAEARINQDIHATAQALSVWAVREPDYLRHLRTECTQLGL